MKFILKFLSVTSVSLLIGCGGDGTNLSGFTEPAKAPALPATEVDNAFVDDPLTSEQAFRLVEQTTFGVRINDLDSVTGNGPENWINAQMQLPATFMSDGLRRSNQLGRWNEYVNVWWRHAIQADDQLRQRVAFALSQIFVISSSDGLGAEQAGLANYYDLLLRHSFGNYRDLIEDVTLSPVMGEFLSMKGNRKPNPDENVRPDENYARELMQLFSIGLSQLNNDGTVQLDAEGIPVPTYDQDVIEGFAHVFTGWHFKGIDDFRWPSNKDFINPMVVYPEFHDENEKILLNGFVVPAGQTPEQDMKMALDNIFNHPNVGPFIVKQLIQRLITSNPTPGYVEDVVNVFNRNIEGERGNLASTVKAILMHREARAGHLDNPTTFGKLKEPLLRVSQLWRAFGPSTIHPDFNYAWAFSELQQAPLGSPSVFNFFTPDFSQPGGIRSRGLASPEFEITDESSIIAVTSRLLGNTIWSNGFKVQSDKHRIALNIQREVKLQPDRNALLDHLDLLLLGGRMSDVLREEALKLLDARNSASQGVVEIIFLIASSPEAAIQI